MLEHEGRPDGGGHLRVFKRHLEGIILMKMR